MRLTVVSPAAAVFDGPADSIVAPAADGQLGILPHHAPLTALLGEGILKVTAGGTHRQFRVSGGFLQVVDDVVRVLAEEVVEVS